MLTITLILIGLLLLVILGGAMAGPTFDSDIQVSGRTRTKDLTVSGGVDFPTTALTYEHRVTYSQEATANSAAGIFSVYTARGGATVVGMVASFVTAPNTVEGSNGRTVTFDLLKNGTTILSATVKLNSTNTPFVAMPVTLSSAALIAGDDLSVKVTIAGSAGTYPLGIKACVTVREQAS